MTRDNLPAELGRSVMHVAALKVKPSQLQVRALEFDGVEG